MISSAALSTNANTESPLPRVSFQGALGAFSELAIRQQWPNGASPVAQPTFAGAVKCMLEGCAEFAIIPVENVIAGPVHAALYVLDALSERLVQCDEMKLNVRLCLLAPAGSFKRNLREVLSHPMALAQCNNFFAEHTWLTPVVHNDTAAAAQHISQQHAPDTAAIASEAAASRYGLEILAYDIQDIRENWTRFVVLHAKPT